MPYIEILDLHKTYDEGNQVGTPVLDGLSLTVEREEFVSIFGPNGCGKSTLFNAIADLTSYDSGSIRIDGKPATVSRIGFVFQNYGESLFPWLRNLDNIAFALHAAPGGKRAKRERVHAFVHEMGLDELPLDRYPYQCSAGQQQLVTLARELIYEPDVLLMDEPFVSLDYDRRLTQQQHLLNTWRKTNTTILFISHDLDEAIYLADRLVLLSQRPARVVASHEIRLPRPRKMEMMTTEEFLHVKRPILEQFREIIGR